ncbi:MAG: hypothetical protein Q8L11_02705 [Candidatus Moranbacteria bacterium]|nr:hypothetical protein [Candidatus Moranbacteria bacterium]
MKKKGRKMKKKVLAIVAAFAMIAIAPIAARATVVSSEFAEELVTGQSSSHEEGGGCSGGGSGKGKGKGGGGGGQGGSGGHHEEPTPTPVPPAILLLGSGLMGLLVARKKK